ncbi:hypothetical protein KKP06_22085, partial [Ralstonia pickettii]|uniref:hypothetical protein n=1 Tax=Ralstonia pickettii TaxID=329 RepID=UPI001BE4863F
HAGLGFPQHANNLFFGESLLHDRSSLGNGLYIVNVLIAGSRSEQAIAFAEFRGAFAPPGIRNAAALHPAETLGTPGLMLRHNNQRGATAAPRCAWCHAAPWWPASFAHAFGGCLS